MHTETRTLFSEERKMYVMYGPFIMQTVHIFNFLWIHVKPLLVCLCLKVSLLSVCIIDINNMLYALFGFQGEVKEESFRVCRLI